MKGNLICGPASGRIIIEAENDGSLMIYEMIGNRETLEKELEIIKDAIGVWSNDKIKERLNKLIKEVR